MNSEILSVLEIFVVLIVYAYLSFIGLKYKIDRQVVCIVSAAFVISLVNVFIDDWPKIIILVGPLGLLMFALMPKPFIKLFNGYDRTICGMIGAGIICLVGYFQKFDTVNTIPTWASTLVYILSLCLIIPMLRLYSNNFQEYRTRKNAETGGSEAL
jgi:hypothetical protein